MSWLPHDLKLSLAQDKTLTVSDPVKGPLDTPEPSAVEEAHYELKAVVCHVKGIEGRGNLVGHIRADQNEEDSSHQQWFLFNDFVIQPLPKVPLL